MATGKKKSTLSKTLSSPNRALEVEVELSLELGRTSASVDQILEWSEGSIIPLPKVNGDLAEIRVNNELFGRGEVVTIGINKGVRLLEILNT
jgi:flagellar motor switch protein FliN/FliY